MGLRGVISVTVIVVRNEIDRLVQALDEIMFYTTRIRRLFPMWKYYKTMIVHLSSPFSNRIFASSFSLLKPFIKR